jgi:membrane dipeptidase
VDHLVHVIELVGIEHVGIGADFIQHVQDLGAMLEIEGWAPDWGKRLPPFESMLSPEDLPGLTAELRRRGFSEQDLARIYHGNYFRVFERVLG